LEWQHWNFVWVIVSAEHDLVPALWITALHGEPAYAELPHVAQGHRRTGRPLLVRCHYLVLISQPFCFAASSFTVQQRWVGQLFKAILL
jgi:hypothetical protein